MWMRHRSSVPVVALSKIEATWSLACSMSLPISVSIPISRAITHSCVSRYDNSCTSCSGACDCREHPCTPRLLWTLCATVVDCHQMWADLNRSNLELFARAPGPRVGGSSPVREECRSGVSVYSRFLAGSEVSILSSLFSFVACMVMVVMRRRS